MEKKRNQIILDDSASSKTVKHNRIMDFIAKILCLVAAFCLWFYAMSSDGVMIEKDYTVPVAFEKENELYSQTGWSVLSGKDSNVVVTLKGKRNFINRLKEEELYAYVDLSSVEQAGRQNLEIRFDVPTECEIVNTSVSELVSYVDKKLSKNIPVSVVYVDYTVSSQYQLADPILSVNEIAVTGPESELRNVAAAKAELKLGNVTQTLNSMGVLKLVNEAGDYINSSYLTMATTSVGVTVKLFTEKDVPLTVSYKHGYFNSENVTIDISPKTIKLRGEPAVLDKIDSIDVATLDEKQYATNLKKVVPLSLPEDVLNVGGESEVTIDVKHKNTTTRKISVDNIVLVNADESKYTLQTSSINIDLRGPQALIQSITSDDISIVVDMNNYNNVSGVIVVPTTIQFSDGYSDSVYELGTYDVKVESK